jgi:magnesium chelatase family protein
VPALSAGELTAAEPGEASAVVLQRVIAARARQLARQGKINAELNSTELDHIAAIAPEAKAALAQMLEKLSLSARSYHRILRVARTLADLAEDSEVSRQHVLRAIGFRRAL